MTNPQSSLTPSSDKIPIVRLNDPKDFTGKREELEIKKNQRCRTPYFSKRSHLQQRHKEDRIRPLVHD